MRRRRSAFQRGLQVQGRADWQPQVQVEGVAAGVRQPQVQDAPGHGLQAQDGVASVFIWRLLDRWAACPRHEVSAAREVGS
ncbi:hypothetical protein PAGU2595_000960 [Lysobacter xanthus]